MFDDVERKIVESAKTPDRYYQQRDNFDRWMLEKQQDRGGNPDDEEKDPFELDPRWAD